VRQLRGEAHPAVQVKNCDLAVAHGTGGSLGTRHAAATVVMEREVSAMAETQQQQRKIAAPPINPETQPFWDATAHGKLLYKKCAACGEPHFYPRPHCPFLLQRQGRMGGSLGARHDLHLQRHAARAGALCDRLCHLDRRPDG